MTYLLKKINPSIKFGFTQKKLFYFQLKSSVTESLAWPVHVNKILVLSTFLPLICQGLGQMVMASPHTNLVIIPSNFARQFIVVEHC